MAVEELQSVVKLSPASQCPENCMHCVPGVMERSLWDGGGDTDARITGGGTWPPASMVQCCAMIKCSEIIFARDPGLSSLLLFPHTGICVPPLLSVLP